MPSRIHARQKQSQNEGDILSITGVNEGKLLAEIENLAPSFVDAVNEGRYRKISMSLFTPDHPANPKPSTYYPKHVGFLGGAAPAVSGLQPVQFQDDDGELMIAYCGALPREPQNASKSSWRDKFSRKQPSHDVDPYPHDWRVSWEEDPQNFQAPDTKESTLTQNYQAQEIEKIKAHYENEKRVEDLVRSGQLLPVHKDGALAFMDSLDSVDVVSFSDGSKLSQKDWFYNFISSLPKVIEFGEAAPESHQDKTLPLDIYIPKDVRADPLDLQRMQEIDLYAYENQIPFSEAAIKLSQNR